MPIFTGGVTHSQVREQTYLHRAERERLEGAMRGAERETRDAYLGVIAEKARVQALKQAVQSNQTALEATEAGFEVGTRTTVDVLDARRRLFEAQRDYSRSRYDYLINVVRLKSAAGVLAPADLDRDQRLPDDAGAAADRSPGSAPARPASPDAAGGLSSGAPSRRAGDRAPALRDHLLAALAVGARARRIVEPVADALRPVPPGCARCAARRTARTGRPRPARCGCAAPTASAAPSTAGSSRLCPPTGTRLPATNATSAAA